MAVLICRYTTGHEYSVENTRARGYNSGKGGWAKVPMCTCGWNHTNSVKFGPRLSPRGSIFPDYYANGYEAERAWREHMMDVVDADNDVGQLIVDLA